MLSQSAARIELGDRIIGEGSECFIIAEAGVNHNGDLALARALVDAAAQAGADAIKFQSFKADRLVTRDAPKAEYQKTTTGSADSQHAMLRRLELSETAHIELQAYAMARGLVFLSTPFDEESAALLAAIQVPAFKISSGELTNLPLLEEIARFGKPLLLSTGMATLEEVGAAVTAVRAIGAPVALLQCVSNYPAQPADTNLRAMLTMRDVFAVPVGYSDHTLGNEISFAAVALGACILEKHLTLDRTMPGPDHAASAEPGELAALVRGVRAVEAALGDGVKRPALSEANVAAVARRSLVAARNIEAGEILDAGMIQALRPGGGLPPDQRSRLLGRRMRLPIAAGNAFTLEMTE